MINNCNINDIETIKKLGKLINNNFDKLNNIEELINNNKIIGYYTDDKLVGFLVYEKNYEIIDLLYIVVEPIYRKHGIGYSLVKHLVNNLEYDKIMLEVRCDNKDAINLYKKFNFKIINTRRMYYDNMDAYVMELIK